jgi:hypothetical protein
MHLTVAPPADCWRGLNDLQDATVRLRPFCTSANQQIILAFSADTGGPLRWFVMTRHHEIDDGAVPLVFDKDAHASSAAAIRNESKM